AISGVHNSVLKEAQIAIAQTVEQQAELLSKLVPGLERKQAISILQEAFQKESSAVFGGSRIRGNFGIGSDLDVGFGSLTPSQAEKVTTRISKAGPLQLESRTRIVTGNASTNLPKILSPEEFFQRVGVRAGQDLQAGRVFLPSGSI